MAHGHMSDSPHPVLLFDGVCNLCSGTVQFVIARDPQAKVRFASLQSGFAAEAFSASGIPASYLDSIVLMEGGKVHLKSTAALRLTKYLSGLWPLLGIFLLIPRPLRDWVYDWVARNRYRWFGQKEVCWVPDPGLKARFL